MKEKKGNGKNAVIVILVIALLVAVAYIAYTEGYLSSLSDNKKVETKKQTTKQATEKDINLRKSLNTKNVTYTNAKKLSNKNKEYGLVIYVNKSKKEGTLHIDWEKLSPFADNAAKKSSEEKYAVKGFKTNISKASIGQFGSEPTGTVIFFVMENKTVEYFRLFNLDVAKELSYTESNSKYVFETEGAIKGVKDVVRLYSATASTKKSGKYSTVLAKKADGSFYDLNEIIG